MKYILLAILLIGCLADDDNPESSLIPGTYFRFDHEIAFFKTGQFMDIRSEDLSGTIAVDTSYYLWEVRGSKLCLMQEGEDDWCAEYTVSPSNITFIDPDDGETEIWIRKPE